MSTPALQLETLYVLDGLGRLVGAREPTPGRPPAFALVRGATSCAFAIHGRVPEDVAAEPPTPDLRAPPRFADRYVELFGGEVDAGPAFTFPEALAAPRADVVELADEELLHRHFRGWVPGEIALGRVPVTAVLDDGHAVSVCFCARRGDAAAEAGVETAVDFRGRGLAGDVTAAWALTVRAGGRVPLYSTSWSNTASLSVARKLDLVPYASDWKVFAREG
jgi:hypothetical protein